MKITSRRFRLRAVWLLVIPLYWFATPAGRLLAAGALIALVGAGIRAWAAGHLRKEELLTTSGPYAFTRNPLYTGTLFMGVGVTLAGGQPVFIALFLIFYLFVYGGTAFKEERVLDDLFGDSFRHYASQVPLFRPRLTPYQAPRPPGTVEPAPPTRFEGSRYLANREWEAGFGLIVAFGLLVLKIQLL